jgi:hypothetical protein
MGTAFHPRRHGFHFANRFDAPLGAPLLRAAGGPTTWGLCGGMVRCARAAFRQGEALTTRRDPPAPGSPLYRRLLRWQIASLGPPLFPGVRRFARWTRCRDAELARRTRAQLGQARGLLRRGRLVPLGLVYTRRLTRLWENHQALAYAPAASGPPGLRLYDPNEPRRDDVTLAPAAAGGGPFLEKRLDGKPTRAVRGAFVMT